MIIICHLECLTVKLRGASLLDRGLGHLCGRKRSNSGQVDIGCLHRAC